MALSNSAQLNITGISLPDDACVVIVHTEWNKPVIDKLLVGATKVLQKHHVHYKLLEVPGAVEIGFAIQHYFSNSVTKPHAFIALGCVIKGDTPHFDYVCQSVTQSVTFLNVTLPVPVIFGVLTVTTQQQADERLGGTHGHKGEEAAITALKMLSFSQTINKIV